MKDILDKTSRAIYSLIEASRVLCINPDNVLTG